MEERDLRAQKRAKKEPHEQRLKFGLKLLESTGLLVHSAEIACVDKDSLRKAKARLDRGEPIAATLGRKKIVAPAVAVDVTKTVEDRCKASDCVPLEHIPTVINESRAKNNLAPVNMSARTSYRTVNELNLKERLASEQNTSRQNALGDFRNYISCASVTKGCFNSVLGDLLTNSDDVSFLLDGWESHPKVVLTQKMVEWLEENRLSPKVPSERSQRRMVSLFATSIATGKMLHFDCKIFDSCFTQLQSFEISDDLSIWLIPISYDLEKLTGFIFETQIIPKIQKLQEMKSLSIRFGVKSCSHDPDSTAVVPFENEEDEALQQQESMFNTSRPTLRAVVTIDGERNQTKCFTECGLSEKCRNLNIEYLKWAGGCSSVQQPNDVSTCHHVAHQRIRSFQYRHESPPEPSLEMKLFIDHLENRIDSDSFKTYSKFLKHVERFASEAFNAKAVQDGWKNCSYLPFSTAKILSKWPYWEDAEFQMYHEQILAAVDELSIVALERGEVTDLEMQTVFDELEIPITFPPIKTDKADLAIMNRRVTWGNNETFLSENKRRKEAEELAKQEREAVQRAKNASKPATSLEYIEKLATSRKRPIKCADPGCETKLTPTSKFEDWECCCLKCLFVFCGEPTCHLALDRHQSICAKYKKIHL